MNNIKVKILNPAEIHESERMMVAMARMTQRGHKIGTMTDLESLLTAEYTDKTVENMISLPHPTIQKFGVINVAIVGASRRFLAQVTRHQNEVKFMSGSLQYSNYTGYAQFAVPYEIIAKDAEQPEKGIKEFYLNSCYDSLLKYEGLVDSIGRDAAGYAMPQALRNVLIISATPYQLKHMIQQRTCNRNTLETQYVMLLIWEQLYARSNMYSNCGPFCMYGPCPEGRMSCKEPYSPNGTPTDILNKRFEYIRRGIQDDYNC